MKYIDVKDLKQGSNICKGCANKYERERRASESDEKKERYKKYYSKDFCKSENDRQINYGCTVCLKTLSIDNFYEHKRKGYMRAACMDCTKQKKKEYYEQNKEKYNKQITEYQINKVKRDSNFHFLKLMRCRVYNALKSKSLNKNRRTIEYLGCTSDFFCRWIEFQLYDGMTLENYGDVWHVDHVKPIASFDLTNADEVEKCFSWMNCQPLLASKNILKCDNYTPFDSVLQEIKAYAFKKHQPATV